MPLQWCPNTIGDHAKDNVAITVTHWFFQSAIFSSDWPIKGQSPHSELVDGTCWPTRVRQQVHQLVRGLANLFVNFLSWPNRSRSSLSTFIGWQLARSVEYWKQSDLTERMNPKWYNKIANIPPLQITLRMFPHLSSATLELVTCWHFWKQLDIICLFSLSRVLIYLKMILMFTFSLLNQRIYGN